jgi:hypothetical protein
MTTLDHVRNSPWDASRYLHRGEPLTAAVTGIGMLNDATGLAHDGEAMRLAIERDGYVYLRGVLDADDVREARLSVLNRLHAEGSLAPDQPIENGIAHPDADFSFRPDLAVDNPAVERVLYHGAMMDVFGRLLGGPVRHFDFTWLRAKTPGAQTSTNPHCDIVYMSRGTPRLFTAWTPLCDCPTEMGGLIVLEGSHRRDDALKDYWRMDVDTYCRGDTETGDLLQGRLKWASDKLGGAVAETAQDAQAALGGRWLTANFQAGDVLIFCMQLVHSSLDNRTDRIRLSTDSRYQLASEPADERWIGEHPIAHGPDAKKALIC